MPRKTVNGFKFNLLPPKSEKEIEIEVERDDSLLYSTVLVFVAGMAFFGLTMANSLLITPRLQEFKASVVAREDRITEYDQIKLSHGELYIKARTLQPVLEKRIDTSEIFRVTDEITEIDSSIEIKSYGREKDGLFVFEISTPDAAAIPDLISSIYRIAGVSEVFVRSTRARQDEQDFLTIVSLRIDSL